jgi:hypothetical protein
MAEQSVRPDGNKPLFVGGPNTMSFSREKLQAMKQDKTTDKTHYEFYASIISSQNLAKLIILVLLTIIGGLIALIYVFAQKPPIVFKMDKTGRTEAFASSTTDSVFNEELMFLTNQFILNHNDLNPVSVESSLENCLSFTTAQVRNELLAEIKQKQLIETARKYRPTYQIEMGTVQIKDRKHPYYTTYCIVNIHFIKPKDFIRVHVYEITWKKIARSPKNPFGLYIATLSHYDQGNINNNLNSQPQ